MTLKEKLILYRTQNKQTHTFNLYTLFKKRLLYAVSVQFYASSLGFASFITISPSLICTILLSWTIFLKIPYLSLLKQDDLLNSGELFVDFALLFYECEIQIFQYSSLSLSLSRSNEIDVIFLAKFPLLQIRESQLSRLTGCFTRRNGIHILICWYV